MRLLKPFLRSFCLFGFMLMWPVLCLADAEHDHNLHLTDNWAGYLSIIIFIFAYLLVMLEEFIHLRKSKPVLLAAGLIWALVAIVAAQRGVSHEVNWAVRQNLLEYAELFFFLLVAMTYVNAMQERQVFEALRSWLLRKNFGYRSLFWITGTLAFFISPIADNLTTALVMCAVIMAVGENNPKFIALGCINIVVAANAGGAFSPFGDITTLMVWQQNILEFQQFFSIFVPSLISYIVPALLMSVAVPKGNPQITEHGAKLAHGAKTIVALFLTTIAIAVCFHNFLELPPTIGMMAGLALLQFYGFYLKKTKHTLMHTNAIGEIFAFDIFRSIQRLEWDTLLFFYGVVLSVGGLATFGYLGLVSETIYTQWGSGLPEAYMHTPANVLVGIISAIVDNIPVMFAVLTMEPTMSQGQWLLVTLTAGIGGSLLSIGSAAGVALMGQSKGAYTFFSHLKWSWAVMLGYIAAIAAHLWINQALF